MEKMKVEIWSDVMCPFCYIGKRRFEKALEQFPERENIEIVWKSFQLNPDMVTKPEANVMEELAERKGWSMDYAKKMGDQVTNMAKGEGLIFNYDKAVVANSFMAHRLLQYAKTQDKGDELKELLLKSYFSDGKNTDDNTVLGELAVSIGLNSQLVGEVLDNPNAFAEEVHSDVNESRKLGIQGVPFFVLDRKYGISGAQDVQVFSGNLQKAYQEWSGKSQPNIVGLAD